MAAEKAAAEFSDNGSEVYGQDYYEGSFNKSDSPTQFRLNGVTQMTPIEKSRILVDEEDRGGPNILA